MSAGLRKAWAARTPRERAILVVLALLIGMSLYLWLVLSAGRARGQLRASVATLRVQAGRVEQEAAELRRLRAAPTPAVAQIDLRVLVQSQIGAAGLSSALLKIDAPDSDHVVVVFGPLRFADWLAWVANLTLQQVRLDICRIEALSTPGMVSVTATLRRPAPQ